MKSPLERFSVNQEFGVQSAITTTRWEGGSKPTFSEETRGDPRMSEGVPGRVRRNTTRLVLEELLSPTPVNGRTKRYG